MTDHPAPISLNPPARHHWRRRIAWTLALLLAWFLTHLAILLWFGLTDDTSPTDVGVVLGNFVDTDGTPGNVVKARLDRAVELYNAGVFRHVIVSGAVDPSKNYDEPTGMKRYLVRQSIPADAIIQDPGGANTYLTGRNTLRIMREHDWHSATIVTHYYHILRTRFAFARWGIPGVRAVRARLGTGTDEPYRVVREFVAFYRYVFRFYPADMPPLTHSS